MENISVILTSPTIIICICANKPHEIQQMLHELVDESKSQCLMIGDDEILLWKMTHQYTNVCQYHSDRER